jgi:hypothetical protein
MVVKSRVVEERREMPILLLNGRWFVVRKRAADGIRVGDVRLDALDRSTVVN